MAKNKNNAKGKKMQKSGRDKQAFLKKAREQKEDIAS